MSLFKVMCLLIFFWMVSNLFFGLKNVVVWFVFVFLESCCICFNCLSVWLKISGLMFDKWLDFLVKL